MLEEKTSGGVVRGDFWESEMTPAEVEAFVIETYLVSVLGLSATGKTISANQLFCLEAVMKSVACLKQRGPESAFQILPLSYSRLCREGCGNPARCLFRFLDSGLRPTDDRELCLLHVVAAEKAARRKGLRAFTWGTHG